jgi:hypothetical protein
VEWGPGGGGCCEHAAAVHKCECSLAAVGTVHHKERMLWRRMATVCMHRHAQDKHGLLIVLKRSLHLGRAQQESSRVLLCTCTSPSLPPALRKACTRQTPANFFAACCLLPTDVIVFVSAAAVPRFPWPEDYDSGNILLRRSSHAKRGRGRPRK